jgi:hypothetical protein
MRLSQPDRGQTPVEDAVLESLARIIADRLDRAAEEADGDVRPILIQVDGPGRTQFLAKLATNLDPAAGNDHRAKGSAWTAIRFDAWRYQRVAPPWWWLMSEIDNQLRKRWPIRHRRRDAAFRLLRFGTDLLWVLPGGAALAFAGLLWDVDMLGVLNWVIAAAGGVLALLALIVSLSNAVRRHLLARSPRGASDLLQSSDPMEDLLRRYSFLLRSSGRIIVLIDDLDRCRADYVVEMLEGVQTLLRNPQASRHWWLRRGGGDESCPFVAFVFAADRSWLSDSYRHVYSEFETVARQSGRPFGQVFVDKVFDLALRIPTVPPSVTRQQVARCGKVERETFADCCGEVAVRKRLQTLEGEPDAAPPLARLRICAVLRLSELEMEDFGGRQLCGDTAVHLDELLAALDPGLEVQRQLDVAYCVQRTTQLLAGHAVDDDDDAKAIERLALWTILDLKWPLLAERLELYPNEVEHLKHATTPAGVGDDLKDVFTHPLARRLIEHGPGLTQQDVERFTTHMRRAPQTEPVAAAALSRRGAGVVATS